MLSFITERFDKKIHRWLLSWEKFYSSILFFLQTQRHVHSQTRTCFTDGVKTVWIMQDVFPEMRQQF
jgi:hypothetical protein